MNYEEAARILGPDGVRRAEEFVASLPPLTPEQVETIAQILHGSTPAAVPATEQQSETSTDAA